MGETAPIVNRARGMRFSFVSRHPQKGVLKMQVF